MTENIRSNVYKHGTKILRTIVEHYESGGIDVPDSNHMLMQLFALVIEGKVRGDVCEETGFVKWGLTKQAQEDIERVIEEKEKLVSEGDNVLRGPWR